MNIGDKAPEILGKDEQGRDIRLSDYRGRKLVLYFYPKDNTPGCTKQACGYSESREEFAGKNTVIIGISKDSVASHMKFAEKFGLSFTILSDSELSVIKAYDVWKEKKQYGRVYMGVVRTTYLIDENGMIVFASDKVKAADDFNKMLQLV